MKAQSSMGDSHGLQDSTATTVTRGGSFASSSNNRLTYQHSENPAGMFRQSEDYFYDSQRMTTMSASARQTEMKIMAAEPLEGAPPESRDAYKGRIKTWPGIVLLVGLVGAAIALMIVGAVHSRSESRARAREYEQNLSGSRRIRDGFNGTGDVISDDGQVGNPKTYTDMGCELPDYQSKNGQIYARSKNGTEVPVGIKGVNWFGMETGISIPLGLWENQDNGTSAYEIASFLARNKFNSVRLPLCIKNILNNKGPDKNLINLNSNRAINISTYMTTLQTIIQSLAFRHVTVLISLHTLDPKESGGAWYDDKLNVTEDDFLSAVDMLTDNLCSDKYWNVIGLDLKNEPYKCKWGTGTPDWQKGATLIGNRMLKGCKNWLAFVEGVNSAREITLSGNKSQQYYDWWGGGLQDAKNKPIKLKVENKVVYSPHYYNTGVNPAWYFYGGGTAGPDGTLVDFVELDDDALKYNIKATMMDMFGYLAENRKEAVVLGEFAGLYANDKHPKKTTKRTTDISIEVAMEADFAGGFMWSLNPESAYQFNPADTFGHFTEGLLMDDWLTPNKPFLQGMTAMDKVRDLKMFPCFPVEKSS